MHGSVLTNIDWFCQFFNYLFTSLGVTFRRQWEGGVSLTHILFLINVLLVRSGGYWELYNGIGSQWTVERTVEFELEAFQFWIWRFNPFIHKYWKMAKYTLKILQCEHCKILKVCMANFQHEWNGAATLPLSIKLA